MRTGRDNVSAQLGVGQGISGLVPPPQHSSLGVSPQPSPLPVWHPGPLKGVSGPRLGVGHNRLETPRRGWSVASGGAQHTPPPPPEWARHLWQSPQACKEAGGGSISGNKAPFLPSLRNAWHPSHPRLYPCGDPDPRVHSVGPRLGTGPAPSLGGSPGPLPLPPPRQLPCPPSHTHAHAHTCTHTRSRTHARAHPRPHASPKQPSPRIGALSSVQNPRWSGANMSTAGWAGERARV